MVWKQFYEIKNECDLLVSGFKYENVWAKIGKKDLGK